MPRAIWKFTCLFYVRFRGQLNNLVKNWSLEIAWSVSGGIYIILSLGLLDWNLILTTNLRLWMSKIQQKIADKVVKHLQYLLWNEDTTSIYKKLHSEKCLENNPVYPRNHQSGKKKHVYVQPDMQKQNTRRLWLPYPVCWKWSIGTCRSGVTWTASQARISRIVWGERNWNYLQCEHKRSNVVVTKERSVGNIKVEHLQTQ